MPLSSLCCSPVATGTRVFFVFYWHSDKILRKNGKVAVLVRALRAGPGRRGAARWHRQQPRRGAAASAASWAAAARSAAGCGRPGPAAHRPRPCHLLLVPVGPAPPRPGRSPELSKGTVCKVKERETFVELQFL